MSVAGYSDADGNGFAEGRLGFSHRVERWLLCRNCGAAGPCVEQGGVTASVWMCISLSGSTMSWDKNQRPCGGFLCFRFDPSSVLSLLKLVLVWAAESLGFSVPPRHRPGPVL